jgi:hypothetical protein
MSNPPTVSEENPIGRPPKITDVDIIQTIIDTMVDDLGTQAMAAHRAGITEKTFYNYMNKGKEIMARREEDPSYQMSAWDDYYVAFVQAVQDAEDEIKRRHLENIEQHSITKWQASAWILERRWPEEFSLRTEVKHTGASGGPVEFTVDIGKPPSDDSLEEPIEADYEIEE